VATVVHGTNADATLGTLTELTRLRVSALSSLTGAAGYVACARGVDWGVAPASIGIVLLAMGGSALNQVQERDHDALMMRTRHRPLPTGAVSQEAAVGLALALSAVGFAMLLTGGNLTAGLMGLLAMFWYNGVYTPLKRVTAFAAVPGALVGALPPVIGWAAAGGNPLDPTILALCTVLFIWQVPHFWLVLLLYGEDYERAAFPTIERLLSRAGLSRLTFTWLAVTATSSVLVLAFGAIRSAPSALLLSGAALSLAWQSLALLRPRPLYGRVFLHTNLFALALVLSVLLDPLFAR